MKINFTCFLEMFKYVITRKFKIVNVAYICSLYYTFFPALLKYNSHIALYRFKVLIRYTYVLPNDYYQVVLANTSIMVRTFGNLSNFSNVLYSVPKNL